MDVLDIFLFNHSRYRCVKLRYTLSSGLGRIVFWKVLEITNKKIIKPSADAMVKMMRRVKIPETVAYETVKSTTSRMDYPYAHVLKYYSFSYVPASVPQ